MFFDKLAKFLSKSNGIIDKLGKAFVTGTVGLFRPSKSCTYAKWRGTHIDPVQKVVELCCRVSRPQYTHRFQPMEEMLIKKCLQMFLDQRDIFPDRAYMFYPKHARVCNVLGKGFIPPVHGERHIANIPPQDIIEVIQTMVCESAIARCFLEEPYVTTASRSSRKEVCKRRVNNPDCWV